MNDTWIAVCGEAVLWLPPEYRFVCSAIHGNTHIWDMYRVEFYSYRSLVIWSRGGEACETSSY